MSTEEPADDLPEFWNWSLTAYDTSGVAEIMLCMQDEFGLNVNLILWCLWAGEFYPGLEDEQTSDLLNSTVDWHRRVTVPLRHIRRDIKALKGTLPKADVKGVRREVKNLELESERIEQNFLAEATHRAAGTGSATDQSVCHLLYFKRYRLLCVELEQAGNLGLEEQTRRVTELFADARDLIFLKETAEPDV